MSYNKNNLTYSRTKSIAFIGGGPANLMAIATLLELKANVQIHLFEKNAGLGQKLLLTGGGRCNLTTALSSHKQILSHYTRGAQFLKSALAHFPPKKVRAWFSAHGLETKEEDNHKVYPVSDDSRNVLAVFEKIFAGKNNLTIHLNSTAKDVRLDTKNILVNKKCFELANSLQNQKHKDHKFILKFNQGKSEKTEEEEIFDALVIGSGGQANLNHDLPGSGYFLAKKLGHHVTQTAPSLTSFQTQETWPTKLAGLSLADCKIKYTFASEDSAISESSEARARLIAPLKTRNFQNSKTNNNNQANQKTGYQPTSPAFVRLWGGLRTGKQPANQLVFTHFGLSGPAIFTLSSHLAFEKITPEKPFAIKLIINAQKDLATWDKLLIEKINQSRNKIIKNILAELLPARLAEQILILAKINPDKKVADLKKEERKTIARLLGDGLEIHLIARKNGEGMVTAGGVELSEVDPKTCQSKLWPNLFFIGEVLGIDGLTGGFNLQNCWMTGRLAGESLSKLG